MSDTSTIGTLLLLVGIGMMFFGFGTFMPSFLILIGLFLISPIGTIFLLIIVGIALVIAVVLGISLGPVWAILGAILWFL